MTTHAEVGGSCALREAIPALAELIAVLGDPAVRHRGTLGGSLAWNDPRADYAPACVALGAAIVTDRRAIGSDAFFTGSFETALERAEIVVGATFLIPDRAAYVKFRNPASRYALAGVFVAQRAGAVRVAVTGAGTRGVFRWPEAEAALGTDFMPGSLDGLVLSQEGIGADIHGDAQYRVHLVGIMARRAVRAALER
jgi:carbon-monoxide dehydrogenase medium subunit